MSRSPATVGMPPHFLPVVTLMIVVVMMDSRAMTAMLPDIASDMDSTVAGTGIALTAYFIAYGVFQLAYGPIADRIGGTRVMAVAAVAFAIVLAATALAPGLGGLIGLRFLAGAVASAFFPLALAIVGTLVPYEGRQAAVGTLLAAVALGQIMGAAVGGIVTDLFSWRAMFLLEGVVATAMLVPLWRLRSAVGGTARSGSPFAAHRRLVRNPQALSIYAVVLLEGAAFFGGTTFLGALLNKQYGVSLAVVGLILMLEGAAIFVTGRMMGRIAPRLGETRLILIGGLLAGAAYVFIAAVGSWLAVIPAMVVLGVGFGLCHSTLQTRATTVDPLAQGTAISLFAFSLFAGSAIGTAVLSRLLDAFGYDAIMLASGLVMLLVGLVGPRLTAPRVAATLA